ncbi:MAG TPA: zf-HC2 domain-containing protein [Candidatus Krumholzibacteria bacterium]|nr:zf-HC2 domain-containing protein [Candidatus Krumholzibacteria bacterium]
MDHRQLIDLVLQHEDLTETERRRVDEHLAACPSCRTMLARVREAERTLPDPGDMPQLPPDPDGDPSGMHLTGDDLRQAQASRTLLLERVASPAGRRRIAPLGWGGLAMALAACLALLLVGRVPDGGDEPFHDVRLAPAKLARGGAAAPLQPGDAYVVRFTPDAPGWPVVVAQDPDGAPRVQYPYAAQAPRAEAGAPLALPEAGSPYAWRWSGPGGTVWLAFAREGAVDPAALQAVLAGARTADEIARVLEHRFGAAAVIIARPDGASP